jgi:exodeoxyribonuclease VII large subunit
LWEFNEEALARAVAASAIPVVSAVGHEIDFTICDFVADLRAPTPSAAAELIAPDAAELSHRLAQWTGRMQRAVGGLLMRERAQLAHFATGSLVRVPRARLDAATQETDLAAETLQRMIRERIRIATQRLADLSTELRQHRPDQRVILCRGQAGALRARFGEVFRHQLDTRRQRFARGAELLRLLSPDATLQRGYSITRRADGSVLKSARDVAPGTALRTRLRDGEIASVVEGER